MQIKERNGNFVITDFNELESYKIACKIESDGIHFYKKILEKSVEDKAKETIKYLIKEEDEHFRFFEGLLFEISQKEEDRWEGDDLLSSMDYGIFQPYENINNLEKILDDPKKILRLGILIEEKSIKFYSACKDVVSTKKTKNEISKIIEEEYKHKKLLEDMFSKI